MGKTKEMDIVFILDKSGSMSGVESDTIGGYNSYIRANKNNNVKVTTVLFNDSYSIINSRKNIKQVKNMTIEDYKVGGTTALLDAIGKSIDFMEECNPKKVMFVITTDGLENSSRKYTKEEIKKKIQMHNNWEFVYIGANIDSYSEASSIGISKNNIANYKKDKKGVRNLFSSVGKIANMFYDEMEIDTSWKEDLEDVDDYKEDPYANLFY